MIHPDGVEHKHARLVLLNPCQEGNLLGGFENIHISIYHRLHCCHIVFNLSIISNHFQSIPIMLIVNLHVFEVDLTWRVFLVNYDVDHESEIWLPKSSVVVQV